MNFIKSIESPLEVCQTQHLAHSVYFLPLRPMDVQRTGQSGQSDDFLLQGDFTRLSPDLDWTSSGIWSSLTDSVGSPTGCPVGLLELAGSSESPLEFVGKGGGSVKYMVYE